MSDLAIRVEHLYKRYNLGQRESYKMLRDVLSQTVGASLRRLRGKNPAEDEAAGTFWALQDISFDIHQGEAIGIIGRNGAGKSTLLKILSRITKPTHGTADIYGRVGSLLEVGTGFHPELSGRENIYLNGAILGMKRQEIARKFDEIVDFAEIEKFLDMPVKRYSSGMYVRLAFAVAAHLEPEILLVDEVLAVGDVQFQKKCLGKMGDVAKTGRTILFVSHNMGALLNLCPSSILLDKGALVAAGSTQEIVQTYISIGKENKGESLWKDPLQAPGNDKLRLHAVRIISEGEVTADVSIDKPVQIEIEFENLVPGAEVTTSIHLLDKLGVTVLASANMPSASLEPDPWYARPYPIGLFKSTCTIPANFLNDDTYNIHVILLTQVSRIEVFARDVVSFTAHETGGMRKEYSGTWIGVVRPKLAWQTQPLKPNE